MADLVLVHKDTGEELLLNRDQIIHAEIYAENTDVLMTGGLHVFIREKLTVLRDRPN